MARVPLIPINQSASERQRAASASGSISSSLRRLEKPSRMAPGVIDCSHRRLTGCLALAFCAIRRKISSPSRPASQALIRVVTSLRLISLFSTLRRASVLAIGLSAKYGGIIGRCAKLHLPRLTSCSSGTAISSRWPTAEDSTYSSDSKYSSCLVKPPSVFAISFATDGFSAMMRVLLILVVSIYSGLGAAGGNSMRIIQCIASPGEICLANTITDYYQSDYKVAHHKRRGASSASKPGGSIAVVVGG